MPTEDQLKSQMQAAIAAKKRASIAKRSDVPEDTSSSKVSNGTPSDDAPSGTSDSDSESRTTEMSKSDEPPVKVKTSHPAIYQPSVSTATPQNIVVDPDPAVSSDAELTRSFFGRPIRVAIYNKQVYFAIPDVLNVSNDPDKHERYSQLHQSSEKNDFLDGLIQRIRFPSPNGGHDKLDAATADNLIKIINKLELKFPEPIEKWLLSITESLIVLL